MKAASNTLNLAHGLIAMGLLLGLCITSHAQGNSLQRMLEMSEQLDRQDSQDFSELLGQAERCTRTRDYACSERKLQSAQALATTAKQRQQLQQARQAIAAEKAREAEEIRLAEERQREEERRIARQMEEAEAAERANSRANTMAALSAALGSVAPRNSLEQTWSNQARQLAQIQADGNRQRELERQRQLIAAQNQRETDRLRQEESRRARQNMEQLERESNRQRLAQADTTQTASYSGSSANRPAGKQNDGPVTPVLRSVEPNRGGPFTCDTRIERKTYTLPGWGDSRDAACADANAKLKAQLNLGGVCGPTYVLVKSDPCQCGPIPFDKGIECKISYVVNEQVSNYRNEGPASGVSR